MAGSPIIRRPYADHAADHTIIGDLAASLGVDPSVGPGGARRLAAQSTFDQIDADGSGSLDLAEIMVMAESLGKVMDQAEAEAIFHVMTSVDQTSSLGIVVSGSVDQSEMLFMQFYSWWVAQQQHQQQLQQRRAWLAASHSLGVDPRSVIKINNVQADPGKKRRSGDHHHQQQQHQHEDGLAVDFMGRVVLPRLIAAREDAEAEALADMPAAELTSLEPRLDLEVSVSRYCLQDMITHTHLTRGLPICRFLCLQDMITHTHLTRGLPICRFLCLWTSAPAPPAWGRMEDGQENILE